MVFSEVVSDETCTNLGGIHSYSLYTSRDAGVTWDLILSGTQYENYSRLNMNYDGSIITVMFSGTSAFHVTLFSYDFGATWIWQYYPPYGYWDHLNGTIVMDRLGETMLHIPYSFGYSVDLGISTDYGYSWTSNIHNFTTSQLGVKVIISSDGSKIMIGEQFAYPNSGFAGLLLS